MGQDRRGDGPAPSGDWTRANLAIAIAWGALAVVFCAYAFVRHSLGAAVFAVAVIWCMRLAWVAAWRGEED